tara:strand:- start:402 stop:503 length:102 start_codon:yes stop_codon:yes gene_type:complete
MKKNFEEALLMIIFGTCIGIPIGMVLITLIKII